MVKWEYKFFKINVAANQDQVIDALNETGADGWELVSVADCRDSQNSSLHWQAVYFKRPRK